MKPKNSDFNIVTLMPIDSEDRKNFWTLCREDIGYIFTLNVGFLSFYWIPSLLAYIAEPTHAKLVGLVYHLVYTFGWIATWLVSRRWKNMLVYLLPVVYVLSISLDMCIAANFESTVDLDITGEGSQKMKSYLALMYVMILIMFETLSF